MSKPKASGGRFSFFSPLYLFLALLMGFAASVSSWFTEHLTVAGMGFDFFLSAVLSSAAVYILLVLLDFLFESARASLLSKKPEEAAQKSVPEKTARKPSRPLADTSKISASSIGLSGNTSKYPIKDLTNVVKVFTKELPDVSGDSANEQPKSSETSSKESANAKVSAKKNAETMKVSAGKLFLLFFLVSFLVFLPAFLALFPGYTAYDTPMQMEQFFTRGILNSTQPVPLTLLFAGCLRIGVTVFHSANAGLLLHTVLQLFFTSACLACVGCFFVRWGLKLRVVLFLIIFLELLPFVQIFSVTTAKDGFFSPLFALWLALGADIFMEIDRKFPKGASLLCYGLVSFLLILIRPQGKYLFIAAVLVLFLLIIIKARREAHRTVQNPEAEKKAAAPEEAAAVSGSRKKPRLSLSSSLIRLAALAAAVLLSTSLITGPLYRAAGVYPASPSEMLSVPIQQMTRVVALRGSELSPEELAVYDAYLDRSKIATNYIPQISDLMKMSPVFNKAAFAENPKDFFALWLRLFQKYPKEYADAMLYLTDGYFYQGLGYGHAWAGLADEFVPGPAEYATQAVSLLPAYRAFLLENVGKTFAVNMPVVRRLCVISLPFWILAALGSLVLRKRRPASVGILFLLVLYFGTLLLGPVCTVRYTIPLLYAVPVLAALLIAEPGTGSR